MMRSMYSGVAGLKAHQTKMDVIGNNIANVNTVGFKSSSVTFSDVLYQTTQSASGPNPETGAAGKNAKQIGLGSVVNGIAANVSVAGGTQTTDNPFDIMINGDGFFIVNQGGTNYFTKAGAFKIDAAGTLCTSAGATVMGWQATADGTGITKDTVSALNVMSADKMFAEPEATGAALVTGNIDTKDKQASGTGAGLPVSYSVYDNKGDKYTVKLLFKESGTSGTYNVSVGDVMDSEGQSLFSRYDDTAKKYVAKSPQPVINFGASAFSTTDAGIDPETGAVTSMTTGTAIGLVFDQATGKFKSMGTATDGIAKLTINTGVTGLFNDIDVDFSQMTNFASGGTSTAAANRGDKEGKKAGKQVGEMQSIRVDGSGKIIGSYSNGTSKYLGQLALAEFANPSGLEAVGGNLFAETKNSGEFDGIGVDPSSGSSSLTTGALEMSNVDLSAQFTDMIVTQRGFQANSRIITTTDTMLEELINLKR
ncbi:flagellar hook protein FlgE [[Clostridium] polysaccharolyticum]|uniref:Flagellar hook protein FlgE n=1 Tax=[Clostridium] polysaccharolyticum TaxID=29364 RepID=A0A1H9Y277_9FIRM|nr:flagellar hook protein FlgE [[Clostridium] polysaccharolyticum]SES62811.1 flagellar hook protein FlgE [[Clostridium] polysaccharolyticum]